MTCSKPLPKTSKATKKGPYSVAKTKEDTTRQLAAKRLPPHVVKQFDVVTLCDVARALNCTRPTVYKLCRNGELNLLTKDGVDFASGGEPLKILGLVCITLASWNQYRKNNGIA